MSQETDDLVAKVTEIRGTVDSAIALIGGITGRINDAVTTALAQANADANTVAAAVRAATADIQKENQDLAAAVASVPSTPVPSHKK